MTARSPRAPARRASTSATASAARRRSPPRPRGRSVRRRPSRWRISRRTRSRRRLHHPLRPEAKAPPAAVAPSRPRPPASATATATLPTVLAVVAAPAMPTPSHAAARRRTRPVVTGEPAATRSSAASELTEDPDLHQGAGRGLAQRSRSCSSTAPRSQAAARPRAARRRPPLSRAMADSSAVRRSTRPGWSAGRTYLVQLTAVAPSGRERALTIRVSAWRPSTVSSVALILTETV